MAEKHIVPNLRGTAIGKGIITANTFVGVGRTTPWADEENPPAPSSTTTTLEELIIYKRPNRLTFVTNDDNGEITILGEKYRALTLDEARNLQAQQVLIQITLSTVDFGGPANYRQIGVFTYVVPTAGNESKSILLPSEIEDPGIIIHITNRSPYYCYTNHGETINLLVAF